MTVVSKALLETTQITNADVTYYTAPANTRVLIDKVTATNVTAGAVTLTANIVASGGAVGAANINISAQSLAGNTTYLCPEVAGHTLNPGDFLSFKASAGASINVRVSGREVS